jgi:hypothetical protein
MGADGSEKKTPDFTAETLRKSIVKFGKLLLCKITEEFYYFLLLRVSVSLRLNRFPLFANFAPPL